MPELPKPPNQILLIIGVLVGIFVFLAILIFQITL